MRRLKPKTVVKVQAAMVHYLCSLMPQGFDGNVLLLNDRVWFFGDSFAVCVKTRGVYDHETCFWFSGRTIIVANNVMTNYIIRRVQMFSCENNVSGFILGEPHSHAGIVSGVYSRMDDVFDSRRSGRVSVVSTKELRYAVSERFMDRIVAYDMLMNTNYPRRVVLCTFDDGVAVDCGPFVFVEYGC